MTTAPTMLAFAQEYLAFRQAVEAVEARLFSELDPNGPKLAIVLKTALPVSARSA